MQDFHIMSADLIAHFQSQRIQTKITAMHYKSHLAGFKEETLQRAGGTYGEYHEEVDLIMISTKSLTTFKIKSTLV